MLPKRQYGFTLLELLVALLLTGLVAVGVHNVFATMADSASRVATWSRNLDTEANQSRLLHDLVKQVETTGSTESNFGGDQDQVTFTTWCRSPRGWVERCRASLTLARDTIATSVVAHLSTGETFALSAAPPDASLRYLSDFAAGGQWVARWAPGPLTPRAIGIVSRRDTIILRIGDRG